MTDSRLQQTLQKIEKVLRLADGKLKLSPFKQSDYQIKNSKIQYFLLYTGGKHDETTFTFSMTRQQAPF